MVADHRRYVTRREACEAVEEERLVGGDSKHGCAGDRELW